MAGGLQLLVLAGLLAFLGWAHFVNSDLLSREETEDDIKSLDSISSADIAYNLASLGRFREASWIEIQAYNSRTLLAASGGLPLVPKPAVINSTVRNRADILEYGVAKDDTVASLANHFDVDAEDIRLSNGLRSNLLREGAIILIPPRGLSGIVHQITADDTLLALLEKHNFSVAGFLSFNDLESFDDLTPGELVFLPNAAPASVQYVPDSLTDAITGQQEINLDINSPIRPNCHGCGPVDRGDVIGRVGNNGWSTGPHLHIEVIGYDGRRQNPWAFINQNRLQWPVSQSQRLVTQIYHSGHRGLDIGDKEATNIVAIDQGEIIHRGCLWEESNRWSTFGIIIDHGGYYSLSIHMQAPNNPIYENCSINRRSQFGQKSIDYSVDI